MNLSERLATHIVETKFEDIPSAAIEAAKRSLLDAIGVTLGASGLEPACLPFVELAREAGGKAESTVLGFDFKAPAQFAAAADPVPTPHSA